MIDTKGRPMKPLLAVFAFALLAAAPPVLAVPKQGDAIIRHVTIIAVEAAKTVAGQAVVVKGDDIVAVGADAVIAKAWRTVRTNEGKGRSQTGNTPGRTQGDTKVK